MSTVKSYIRKIKFALGREPKVVQRKSEIDKRNFIPESFKAVLIISADFELAWAWRYARDFENPGDEALRLAKISRTNVPQILELCDRYEIPITWATVGHLLLDGCSKNGNIAHSRLPRIPYHENEYWKYDRGDWFDDDPCSDWQVSPEWYAPDLIRMILAARVKHEVACHTFSHINCSDILCSPQVFEAEINECQKSARSYGIRLKSFVHPGNIIGNLDSLRKLGFTSFRTDCGNKLDYPSRHENGLWELKSTMELVWRREWSLDYHLYRNVKIIERAIMYNKVCLFWFHPSIDPHFVNTIMPALCEFISLRRKSLMVTTMSAYVSWLETR